MNGLTLFVRGLRTRWVALTVGVLSIFVMLLATMAVVKSMDLSILELYPEALLQMMGIPAGASVEAFAYGSILTLMAGLTFGGIAVAIGADILAGEERRRTLAAELSHPVSRSTTVIVKAAVLITVLALASAALWATTWLANVLLDVDPGDARLLELCIAIGANALFHGALAFVIGAITGDKGLAGGIAGGVLAIGWLSASVLPLVPEYEDAARYVPYGWFTEANALVDGLDAGYLALQLGLALLFLVVGGVWFVRRDLRTIAPKSLKERISDWPLIGKLSGRRTKRPATLLGMVFERSTTLLWVVCLVMAVFTVLMGPVWDQVQEDVDAMMASMPMELMGLFGAGEMSTPAGFLWGEMFGMMAPAAAITLAAVIAGGIPAEEASGRLGLILSHPVRRSKAVLATAITLVTHVLILVVVQGLATWAAGLISDLDIPIDHIVGASAHLFGLGISIGGLALLVGSATGSSSAATWTAVGLGVIGHFSYAALAMSEDLAPWGRVSPFHFYASRQPLANGADWGQVLVLLAVGLVAMLMAIPFFERRDLRV